MSTSNPEPKTTPSTGPILAPLVPGLCLVTIVLIGAGLTLLAKGPPVVELRRILDNGNPVARAKPLADFQAALKKNETLASDPDVALELLRRVDRHLELSLPAEKAFADRVASLKPEDAEQERQMLLADREYMQELITTLPCTLLPVGLPILCELAGNEAAVEASYRKSLRRSALGALGTLGESVERCGPPTPEYSNELARKFAVSPESPRIRAGTTAALTYLANLDPKRPDMLGVDLVILKCAAEDDPALRQAAAFCARHWPGTPAQNTAMESLLLKMLADDGHGPGTKEAKPGFSIRSQAVLSLAWRGSPKVPLDRLKDLLDPVYLRTELGDGNEALVDDLLTAALTATYRLAFKKKEAGVDLSSLLPAVEKLASDAKTPAVRSLAETTRAKLTEKETP